MHALDDCEVLGEVNGTALGRASTLGYFTRCFWVKKNEQHNQMIIIILIKTYIAQIYKKNMIKCGLQELI